MKFPALTRNSGNDRGIIQTKKTTYNRAQQKYYYLPIKIWDTPSSGQVSQTGTSTLTLTVQDSNDHDQKPGQKEVTIYNYKGMFSDISLGDVYAEDPDDWDRGDKTFRFVGVYPGFR